MSVSESGVLNQVLLSEKEWYVEPLGPRGRSFGAATDACPELYVLPLPVGGLSCDGKLQASDQRSFAEQIGVCIQMDGSGCWWHLTQCIEPEAERSSHRKWQWCSGRRLRALWELKVRVLDRCVMIASWERKLGEGRACVGKNLYNGG